MRVLIVDDDVAIGHVLNVALSTEETVDDVRVVNSGQAALDLAGDFLPDIVILDYWMPGMDGAEAALKIRQLFPEVRIVAFSAALDQKPPWADDFYQKGDLPDLNMMIHLDA